MAKANGIIKIEGTVEELTFYKQNGKNLVPKKGGVLSGGEWGSVFFEE